MLSATYRQSATHPSPGVGKLSDPENKLLWKAPVRRLEAEQIRDAIFSLAGTLDLKEGGPGVAGSDSRRSVYCKVMRNSRDALLDVFDVPQAINSAASRDTTTTPVQSLLLINSPSMLYARKAHSPPGSNARRPDEDEADRGWRWPYRLAFSREPTTGEAATAMKFLNEQAKRIDPKKSSSARTRRSSAARFPYRDGRGGGPLTCPAGGGFQIPGDKLPSGGLHHRSVRLSAEHL